MSKQLKDSVSAGNKPYVEVAPVGAPGPRNSRRRPAVAIVAAALATTACAGGSYAFLKTRPVPEPTITVQQAEAEIERVSQTKDRQLAEERTGHRKDLEALVAAIEAVRTSPEPSTIEALHQQAKAAISALEAPARAATPTGVPAAAASSLATPGTEWQKPTSPVAP